jgi:hypothetical protein
MNENYRKLTARFEPVTRFEVRPAPPAPFRAAQEDRLNDLKRKLLRDALGELPDPRLNAPVRRAANEAAALAWVTPYPLLVFPGLFEEKTALAMLQAERQEAVRERSAQLLVL